MCQALSVVPHRYPEAMQATPTPAGTEHREVGSLAQGLQLARMGVEEGLGPEVHNLDAPFSHIMPNFSIRGEQPLLSGPASPTPQPRNAPPSTHAPSTWHLPSSPTLRTSPNLVRREPSSQLWVLEKHLLLQEDVFQSKSTSGHKSPQINPNRSTLP